MEKYKITIYRILPLFPIIASLALVFRSIIPLQIVLFFFLLSAFYLQFIIIEGIKSALLRMKQIFIKGFLFFIIGLVYFLVIAVSGFNNDFLFKEAFRVGSIFILIFALALSFQKTETKKWFRSFNLTYLFYLLIITCILLFRMVWVGESIFRVMKEWDYNMLAMYFLVGIVLIIYMLREFKNEKWTFYVYNVMLFILVVLLFLTASRRGIIGLSLLITVGFIYTIYTKNIKFWAQKLALFGSLFILIILGSFLMLRQPAIRKYLVFENPENMNVKKIDSIFNRYFSIINKSGKVIGYFQHSSVLNRQIGRNLTFELNQNSKYNQNYYNTLHHLAYFAKNKEELCLLNPDLKQFNDTVFENQLIPKLPGYFNVDYSYDHWFVPIQLNNCSLLSYNLNVSDSVFHFKAKEDNGKSYYTVLLPIVDSSVFTLEFVYYSNERTPVVSANLPDFYSTGISILKDTISNELPGKFKKRMVFKTAQTSDGFLRVVIQFNATDFYTTDFNWSRKRYSKDIQRCYTRTNSNNKWREAELNKLLPVSQHNESFEITCENLFEIHDPLLKGTVFNRYKNAEILESGPNSVKFIKQSSDEGFVKKIIPAIPGFTYVLSFHINNKGSQVIYNLKRYPEANPDYLRTAMLTDLSMHEAENGVFVRDSFEVKDCSSLKSLLVIGSKSADTIQISGLEIACYPCTSPLTLNENQIRQANNLRKSSFKISENQVLDDKWAMNLIIKDSLQDYYQFHPKLSDTLLASTRVERWKFAWFYYKKLALHQKLFGDQLAYLDIYPKLFYSKKAEPKAWDYPHNPLISAFLYSGIIGGLLYLWFLFIVFYRFIKYRQIWSIYLILFLITFIFAFFSGNSHFSIPLFALISFFPFFDYSNNQSGLIKEEK